MGGSWAFDWRRRARSIMIVSSSLGVLVTRFGASACGLLSLLADGSVMKNIVKRQLGRGSLLALAALFTVAATTQARADALSEKGLKKAGTVYAIDEDT